MTESYEDRYRRALGAVSCARDTIVNRIADAYPNGQGISSTSEPELRGLGCSEAQAKRLLAALKLQKVLGAVPPRSSLRTPEAVFAYIRAHTDVATSEQERFLVIGLDSRQRVLGLYEVGRGSLAQVDVHPREVFCPVVRARVHSVLLVHNHPSGVADPSTSDVQLTQRLAKAGKLLGVPVLDHIIVTVDNSVSLAQRGLLT